LSRVDDHLGLDDAVVASRLPQRVPLPAIVQTLWSVVGMDSFIRFCLARFVGERMLTFRIVGFGEVVSVLDPQLIREVFTADSDVLRAGEANAQAVGLLGPNSLLALDGERHLRMRRLLLPPFHGEAIRHHERLIERITAAEVKGWPLQKQFALWPRMRAITMEVILQAVIGVRAEPRRQRLREVLPASARGGVFGMLAETKLPSLAQGKIGRRLPWVRARAESERLLYEEIADHRAFPEGRDDVLALLVAARDEEGRALSDEELRDHMFTLLGAGHDTTAAALAWCFERLLRHPEILICCRQSAAQQDDGYLTAVVNETLRVRPVVESAARKLSAPFELGGYRLAAGTMVTASIAAMQRSPKVWEDPLRFAPERFSEQPAPYTLIPFGGGPRRCIGASFAMMEIKTVLRTVLNHVELRAPNVRGERPSRVRSAGIVPARGARAIVTARLSGDRSPRAEANR
jgi:cytochrome P450